MENSRAGIWGASQTLYGPGAPFLSPSTAHAAHERLSGFAHD
jgi:hypothetical protein